MTYYYKIVTTIETVYSVEADNINDAIEKINDNNIYDVTVVNEEAELIAIKKRGRVYEV